VVSIGATTIEAVGQIHADMFFMGVTGIHPQTGLTTGDYEEAAVKRALSRAAAETFVLASAEKLNAASPYRIVGLDEVSGMITELAVSEVLIAPYRKLGLAITQA
jgi:DeoR/GlpR family transcriptional regulator of sugar metabolism